MGKADDIDFVHGTVYLVDVIGTMNVKKEDGNDIILQPQPTNDPNDPLTWSKTKKHLQFAIVWVWAFLLAATSNFVGPLFTTWLTDLNTTANQIGVFIALGFLALMIGVTIVQPTGLKLGKYGVYNVCTILVFIAVLIGGFAKGMPEMDFFRFLSCFAAAPVDTLVEISANDLYFQHERSTAFSLLILALYAGCSLGPVASGLILQTIGWRWCFFIQAIIYGGLFIFQILFMEDTTFRRDAHAIIEKGDYMEDESESNSVEKKGGVITTEEVKTSDESLSNVPTKKTWKQTRGWVNRRQNDTRSWWTIFYRPAFLITFPAVVWSGIVYGSQMMWLSLVANTQDMIFSAPPYNFTPQYVGFTTLGQFFGNIFGMLYGGLFVDWLAVKLAKKNNGIMEPEHRLHSMWVPFIVNAVGVITYGLGSYYGAHWAIPTVMGQGFIGFAMSSLGAICLTYAVECYHNLASEALVLILVIRNAIGTIFSFTFQPWLAAQGLRDLSYTLFALSLVCNGGFLIFLKWGKDLRRWTGPRYEKYSAGAGAPH
ncbi:unnamed protein product [Candida verbasci]|uniref:Major facilitator superfamily (MFS) profile domain-containing protein n=1 Tax=Candida verbasci TaxID=1227364 RepID=A0A9W4TZ00_9ASCO|nr:unnamed protein product [Candida verbasci]